MDAPVDLSSNYQMKFALMISFQMSSILISLVIFLSFALNRPLRVETRNHSLLLLLIINFIQVITSLPMPISFFRLNGLVQPATSAYCTWWIWYEFSLNTINVMLMAWISIERHLLIFHSPFIQAIGVSKRRILHIGPLIFCTAWGPMFYLITVVISPMCVSKWYFDSLLCGLPCYLLSNWGTLDIFVNAIGPAFIVFLSNLALFLRVVHQNRSMIRRAENNWRRGRKMASQLGLISLLYLAVWFPLSIIQLGLIYISTTFLLNYLDFFNFLVYFVPLLLPMIYLLATFEEIKTLKNRIFPRRIADVIGLPVTNARTNMNFKQTPRTIANTGV